MSMPCTHTKERFIGVTKAKWCAACGALWTNETTGWQAPGPDPLSPRASTVLGLIAQVEHEARFLPLDDLRALDHILDSNTETAFRFRAVLKVVRPVELSELVVGASHVHHEREEAKQKLAQAMASSIRENIERMGEWGLWNTDPVQQCWVSDDDGHFGKGEPKRFQTARGAADFAGSRTYLVPRKVTDLTPRKLEGFTLVSRPETLFDKIKPTLESKPVGVDECPVHGYIPPHAECTVDPKCTFCRAIHGIEDEDTQEDE